MRQFENALRNGAGDIASWVAARRSDLREGLEEADRALEQKRRQLQRNAEVVQEALAAEARRAVDAVARKARPLVIAPPSVTQKASKGGPANPEQAPAKRAAAHPRTWIDEAPAQAAAAARGAFDEFTFGLGDHAVAGVGSLGEALQGKDFAAAYSQRLAHERARDAADAENYRGARSAGQVAGVGAQIVALGPIFGTALRGARIAQATPLILRETGALGAAGAGAGLVGQATDDLMQLRLSRPGDYGGALLGGAVGALTARSGRVAQAGGAAGFTESVGRDVLNGEFNATSAERARVNAAVGAAVGGVVGRSVARHADKMTMKDKEALGEQVSKLRTWARGDKTAPGPKSREHLPGGGYTYPDQRTFRNGEARQLVESKFGRSASLRRRQRQAYEELDNYRVDHTLPRDIGAAFGLPLSVMFPWTRDTNDSPMEQGL